MCHLSEDYQLAEELPKVLHPHEVEALLLAKHKPNYCLQVGVLCAAVLVLCLACTNYSS